MTWRPELTVAAIVQRDERFLIVEERIQGNLVLNQPAGHVEDGESIIDAAVRETLEETAWRFVPHHLLGLYLWRNPASGATILRVAIAGDVAAHDAQRPLDDGIVAAHWMTRAALQARPANLRSPLVLRCIDDFMAGTRHSLDALHHLVALPVTAGA
jgi:8-oxo-dGTP pyrophosphatase MutT (NUDIX family)